MACLAPWAFGAVEAWAEAGLYLGVVLAAIFGAVSGSEADRLGNVLRMPSLALLGLILLAIWQATPLSESALRAVSPATAAITKSLTSGSPTPIIGDSNPPVALPSWTISQDPEKSIDVVARLGAAWVILQTVLGWRGGVHSLRRFGVAIAVNATLLSLFALIQMLSWNGKIYWCREVQNGGHGGPFICHSHLAAYLNLGLGFAFALLATPSDPDRRSRVEGFRLASAYATGLIVVAIIASLSRSGLMGMIAGLAATFSVLKPSKLSMKTVGGGAGILAMMAVFLIAVGLLDPYERLMTFSTADAYTDRFALWRGAIRAWSQYPVWGIGFGSFGFAMTRFYGGLSGVFAAHAEDEYIEIMTEGGVVGLVLGLLILFSVIRSGRRVLRRSTDRRDQTFVAGGVFGIVALAVQCLSDFPMHIPAVAVTVLIVAAHLLRLDPPLRVVAITPSISEPPPSRWIVSAITATLMIVMSLASLGHGVVMARSEFALAGGGIPPAGFVIPTATVRKFPMERLENVRTHLESALQFRPDWAEGHARLGLNFASQYRAAVLKEIGHRPGETGDREADLMANPIRLHEIIHSERRHEVEESGGILGQGPVVRYLVPAARQFLEARRCCPTWDLPHAELSTLDYLLPRNESTVVQARRALKLAGPDGSTLGMAAVSASHVQDFALASLCWRRRLEIHEEDWATVADQAVVALSPEAILKDVVSQGRFTLKFANHLYSSPASLEDRTMFLKAAVERLPNDHGISVADRLHHESQALAGLDRIEPARAKMMKALRMEPDRPEWRSELVGWLIGWNRPREAHDLAVLGLHLAPESPYAKRSFEQAVEAISVGSSRSGSLGSH